MSRKIIKLTESQVKTVLSKIISEQQEGQVADKLLFSVDFQNAFASGQYEFTPEYEKIVTDNVTKIKNFITGKKIQNFKLQISSGESQVPNPKGFEQKGSLATKRAEVLKSYLDQVLPKILGVRPVIEITQPIIGRTEWDPKKGKDNPIYTAEQFIKVNVVLSSEVEKKPEEKPNRVVSVEDTVKIDNRQGNASGIGFVMRVRESTWDPNVGPIKGKTYFELEIFPSDTEYYRTTLYGGKFDDKTARDAQLEKVIEEYKKRYNTNIVRRGTTKQNNYSKEGIAQMKLQNLFTSS